VERGNYPLPISTERERGKYCESLMPLSIFDVMALAKRNK